MADIKKGIAITHDNRFILKLEGQEMTKNISYKTAYVRKAKYGICHNPEARDNLPYMNHDYDSLSKQSVSPKSCDVSGKQSKTT